MKFVIQILVHTPPYVWVILAYLIWQGVQSLQTRTQPVWRLLVVPVILGLTGILMLFGKPVTGMLPLFAWFAAAIVLAPAGFLTGPRLLSVDRSQRSVIRAGSVIPLIRNLIIFMAQYGLAVSFALKPEMQETLATAACAVSGASVGYLGGWIFAFWQGFQKKPHLA